MKWVSVTVSFAAPDDFTWEGDSNLNKYADRLMFGEGLCSSVSESSECSIEHTAGGTIVDYDEYVEDKETILSCVHRHHGQDVIPWYRDKFVKKFDEH